MYLGKIDIQCSKSISYDIIKYSLLHIFEYLFFHFINNAIKHKTFFVHIFVKCC